MAVASAGPYASLHLAPDRQPRQHPTTQFFAGQMPFLPPNQQRQSTEGTYLLHISNANSKVKTIQPTSNTVTAKWQEMGQKVAIIT